MDQVVIKVHGLISGDPTGFDGQYVVEYDPGRNGIEPLSGQEMLCHLVTTPDVDKATKFDGPDAFELWRKPDPRRPLRPDGRPNRPLTAFTVEIGQFP